MQVLSQKENRIEGLKIIEIELNNKVTKHIFIFDLEGFSLMMATHAPTLDILQRLISIYEGLLFI